MTLISFCNKVVFDKWEFSIFFFCFTQQVLVNMTFFFCTKSITSLKEKKVIWNKIVYIEHNLWVVKNKKFK